MSIPQLELKQNTRSCTIVSIDSPIQKKASLVLWILFSKTTKNGAVGHRLGSGLSTRVHSVFLERLPPRNEDWTEDSRTNCGLWIAKRRKRRIRNRIQDSQKDEGVEEEEEMSPP